MIFKNIIRTIWQKPLQFFSLIILVALSSITYVTLHSAINALDYFLTSYANATNQEDFLVVFDVPSSAELKTIIEDQSISVTSLLTQSSDEILKKYEYNVVDYYDYKAQAIEQKYDATLEGRFYRDVNIEKNNINHTYRLIKETDSVNLTYLLAGKMPTESNEIAIFEQYAKGNHLAIGDQLAIKDKTFMISGFVSVPDYIYPIFNYDSPMYEPVLETIVIMNDEVYDQYVEKQWVLYSGYFNQTDYSDDLVKQLNDEDGIAYALGKNQNVRISAVQTDMTSNELLATTFSNVMLIMSVFVIILVLRKRLEADRVQIGILKAMGYSNFKISLNYVLYPIFAAVIGTWIGFFGGSGISTYLSNYYVSHYVVPQISVSYSLDSFIKGVVYPISIISISSFVILLLLLNKKPLQLMRESSHLKSNKTSKFISSMLSPLSFESRFKYSLAFRNFGKIFALFSAVLIASIFLVFAFIAVGSVEKILDKAFGSVNYEYQIKFNKLINEPLDFSETPFIEERVNIYSMTKNEVEKVFDVSTPFFLYGIDPNNFINPLYNSEGETITHLVREGVIINEFIARAYSLSMGDEISYYLNGKLLTLPVVEIVDHYNGPMMYMSMSQLSHVTNYDNGFYNGKWSNSRPDNEDNISYMFSVKDLERNLSIAMEMINVSLYVMVLIAGVLGFMIMIIIANFVIDDNYKQISILKVMGYSEREISNMVLTIYFPFIIMAYLVSIPMTILGIDFIMSKIASQLPIAIPTDFTLIQCILGLSIILATYFMALGFSKMQLKKISLQEVLKS